MPDLEAAINLHGLASFKARMDWLHSARKRPSYDRP